MTLQAEIQGRRYRQWDIEGVTLQAVGHRGDAIGCGTLFHRGDTTGCGTLVHRGDVTGSGTQGGTLQALGHRG